MDEWFTTMLQQIVAGIVKQLDDPPSDMPFPTWAETTFVYNGIEVRVKVEIKSVLEGTKSARLN